MSDTFSNVRSSSFQWIYYCFEWFLGKVLWCLEFGHISEQIKNKEKNQTSLVHIFLSGFMLGSCNDIKNKAVLQP